MYYASNVWFLPSLSLNLKNKMTTLSSLILKTCTGTFCNQIDRVSYHQLHRSTNRALPSMYIKYLKATTLHRISTTQTPECIFQELLVNHLNSERGYKPQFSKNNCHTVGINKFNNRIQDICSELKHDFTSVNFNVHKKLCKKSFLTFNE